MNRSPFPGDFQRFPSVPLPGANIACDPNIGQEIHFQFDGTAPSASLTASSLDVETEMAGFVAAFF